MPLALAISTRMGDLLALARPIVGEDNVIVIEGKKWKRKN